MECHAGFISKSVLRGVCEERSTGSGDGIILIFVSLFIECCKLVLKLTLVCVCVCVCMCVCMFVCLCVSIYFCVWACLFQLFSMLWMEERFFLFLSHNNFPFLRLVSHTKSHRVSLSDTHKHTHTHTHTHIPIYSHTNTPFSILAQMTQQGFH